MRSEANNAAKNLTVFAKRGKLFTGEQGSTLRGPELLPLEKGEGFIEREGLPFGKAPEWLEGGLEGPTTTVYTQPNGSAGKERQPRSLRMALRSLCLSPGN